MAILDYSKEITSLAVGILSLLGKWIGKPRISMAWGHRTSISHILPPFTDGDGNITLPAPVLNVSSFYVRNTGKAPLTGIVIVLNFPPQSFNLWPPRPFDRETIAHNRIAISVSTLAPGEDLWFEMAAVQADVPSIISVRSKEAIARPIAMALLPIAPPWRIRTIQALSASGVVAVVYVGLWLLTGLLTNNWSWLRGFS
ncbi:hypothetical protein [Stenotrophomonas sp. PS02301]|uniref:hypothetical protein n=1 Tax=Stenotrophomonas sp. PS02301 TaxID=2991427 RepID=UPI00249BDB07|nr:hypothetical protein [Stenotrophomonas sp. PS02301]